MIGSVPNRQVSSGPQSRVGSVWGQPGMPVWDVPGECAISLKQNTLNSPPRMLQYCKPFRKLSTIQSLPNITVLIYPFIWRVCKSVGGIYMAILYVQFQNVWASRIRVMLCMNTARQNFNFNLISKDCPILQNVLYRDALSGDIGIDDKVL